MTEQRVYVYRDGQLAYSCICVSGLPTEKQDRITRTGVWYIKEKKLEKVYIIEMKGIIKYFGTNYLVLFIMKKFKRLCSYSVLNKKNN